MAQPDCSGESGISVVANRLLDTLCSYGRVAVAFSAGVDSTVVARAARESLGDDAIAVTAVSPSLADGELNDAKHLARLIGIRHRVIATAELDNADYVRNASNRCYFCKTELYGRIRELLPELGADVIANGANLDDCGDHRPGMTAAREFTVRSPLVEVGLDKAGVRQLARYWKLPVWDKPATPCLSSRIAYGLEVSPARLRRVDRAEQFLREEFGLRELRVRHEANELARVEVPVAAIRTLLEDEPRRRIVEHFRSLGFRCVTIDLEGFRSGSLNEMVPLDELTTMRTDLLTHES